MKFLDKLKGMPRKKLINQIILLTALVYSVIFTSLFYGINVSLFNMIGSIRIPDDQLTISLVPENPMLRASYRVINKGISEVSDLIIDFKVDLHYYELYNNSDKQESIFYKRENVKIIKPWEDYKGYIEGSSEYFNLANLLYFWNHVNLSKPFDFIMRINIAGRYCLGIIPFRINFDELNLECLTCG